MRVLTLQLRGEAQVPDYRKRKAFKISGLRSLLLPYLLLLSSASLWGNLPSGLNLSSDELPFQVACDNVTSGGLIQGDEFGCPNPTWDPSPITNVALPTGGSGTLQYLWIFTTDNPSLPISQWTPIPNSNSPNYDPGPITQTTYFRRCARRSGCTEYAGETNIIVKEAICCDNVVDGGQIGSNQTGCSTPFDPATLVNVVSPTGGSNTLEYQWIRSTVGTPYTPGSPAWVLISGATQADYDPIPVSQTTYYIRLARRHGCLDFNGVSNMVTVSIAVPVVPTATATPASCLGGSNGSINLTIAGGTSPYSFTWSAPLGNVQSPANLTAGFYSVTVTDTNGCTGTTGINVSDVAPLSPVINVGDESCLGANNGTATITSVPGGQAPYNYQWSHSPTINLPFVNNLPPGNYTVTVLDANGCSGTVGFSIAAGSALNVVLAAANETCFGANNGTAEVTSVGNGTPGYNYTWSHPPAGNTSNLLNLPPGSYSVTVTDVLGCTGLSSFSIAAGPLLQVTTSITPVSCFGGNNGTATAAAVNGGIGGFTYFWNDTGWQDAQTATGLTAGAYTVTVTDSQGCTGTGSAVVSDGQPLVLTTFHTNASCGNGNDGTATVQVTGGTSPYFYIWNDPNIQTTATAFGLSAGSYSVTVTDVNGCSAITSATVQTPITAVIQVNSTPASCFGANNGTATVTVVNGNPADYFYQWNTPGNNTGQLVTGLPAGTYTITVTDSNGCLATSSVTVSQPAALVLTTQTSNASCFNGSDGSAEVFVNGGTPFPGNTYLYMWNATGNPQVQVLDDVSPGTYSVTVTDANGCSAIAGATISAPAPISIGVNSTDVSCSGLNNGSASATVSGGVAPYDYLWDDPSWSSSAAISNLGSGVYSVTVTDNNGCSAAALAIIFEPPLLSLTIQKTDVTCISGVNGAATASVFGGVSPYTYIWTGGQTTAQISGLSTGIYSVTVTDANGCTVAGTTQLFSTTTLAVATAASPTTCFNLANGSVQANVSGGTSPYFYLWSNGATSAMNGNLLAGTYEVTVTDANGCSATSSAVVTSPPQLTCAAQVISPVSTYNGSDGSASVTMNGGTGNLTASWSNGSNQVTVSGLTPGTHIVTITDGNGCTCTSTITLINPSRVGNFVWNDSDGDGIQDAGEPGIQGVTVRLVGATASGVQVNLVTTSDASGNYFFDGLSVGSYQVKAEPPALHVFTVPNAGNDDTKDSDINPADSLSAVFQLPQGTFDSRWDIGLVELDEKINIGDFVWEDSNHDGLQSTFEQGIAGVPVRLYQMPGSLLIASTTTNQLGKYLFTNVLPGSYFIEFSLSTLPNGYVFAPQNVGSNDEIDSDPNPANGRTDVFTVFPFMADNLSIDAGIRKECDNVTDGGLIGYDEDLCGIGADPTEIVNINLPSGGFGNLEYLWLSSLVPIYNGPGDPNWLPVPNSNSPNYNPGPISQNTYFIRCSRRQGCVDYPGETNVVAKTVTANPLTQIIQQPASPLCVNQGGDFAAAIAGGGATYYWEFGPTAVPQFANTRVVNGVLWTTPGTQTVNLTVTRFGCSVTVSTTIQVIACTSPILIIDDFNATLQGTHVTLKWKVNGEAGNTLFYIQRSEDSVAFQNLSALAGKPGTENSTYQFVDPAPGLGVNYYRIKYKRAGNSTEEGYSAIVSVFNQPDGMRVASAYPNPTSGSLTIELFEPNESPARVQISNAFGKVLDDVQIPAFSEKMEMDLSAYAQGVYWLIIKQKGLREQVLKLVKVD